MDSPTPAAPAAPVVVTPAAPPGEAPVTTPAPVGRPRPAGAPTQLDTTDYVAEAAKFLRATPDETVQTSAPAEAVTPPASAPPAEPPPPPAPKQEEPAVMERLAAMDREMRKLRHEQKAKDTELEQLRKARDAWKTDPAAALKDAGLSYEQLTEAFITGKKPEPTKLAPEVADLKSQLEKMQQEIQQRDVQAREANLKSQMGKQLMDAGEKYELVLAEGLEDAVYAAIQAEFSETGELPGGSFQAAVDKKAAEFEAALQQRAERLLKTKKLSRTLQPAVAKPAALDGPQAAKGQMPSAPPRTLTNSQLVPATPSDEPEPRTDEEYRARAVRLLRGSGS